MQHSSPFTSEAVAWMAGISQNNTKDFFVSHKEQYDHAVRQPFIQLMDRLAKEFGGTPHVFRVNRDVRFSADKTPYKTSVSGYLANRSEAHALTYLEFSISGLFAATGYYQMARDQLERYRARLFRDDTAAYAAEELNRILAAARQEGFDAGGARLKTSPRGIPRDAPNADLLAYTSLTVSGRLPLEDAMGTDPVAFARTVWKAGQPLNEWLDANVGPSAETGRLG